MGKGGVLWGRLEMATKDSTRVIYWRNRSIYRQQTSYVNPLRDAAGIRRGSRTEHRLRIAGTNRINLDLARKNVRNHGELIGTVTPSRRGRDGLRTSFLFTVTKNRNRQGRPYPFTRFIVESCKDYRPHSHLGGKRPFGIAGRNQVGGLTETKSFGISRHHYKSKTAGDCWFTKDHRMTGFNEISFTEQGRSGCEEVGVTDDAPTSCEIQAATAAWSGPRMVHKRVRTCTDARY